MTTDLPRSTSDDALGEGLDIQPDSDPLPRRKLGACSSAVEQARRTLGERLTIHPDACHDLKDLDSAPQAAAWGKTLGRGLVALGAYAEAVDNGFTGDFRQWCKYSGHADAWPCTSKKLAMRESQTVLQNGRLRRSRVLPVDSEVDRSGFTLMQAHLKISEGGGDLAPRVYFVHDSRSHTVHVGYIGPHKNMRNTRS
ncbi:hypothetical protein ERC79_19475 [Rhodococcus sp. ABRD24]|uniref:hypothetical protein n=1 Tax=Rhodococcus sp. ABRD24 TaxID=2507582 RepID=UPI00103CB060|nr:hypothetical protein [Rhodococcus sp. ABRD24]QBJ97879.1 hypothetical protein ERC79_19475 [Rhodococcus sp. ABRD24]